MEEFEKVDEEVEVRDSEILDGGCGETGDVGEDCRRKEKYTWKLGSCFAAGLSIFTSAYAFVLSDDR